MLAYFDCFSGISGDMLIGSLLDAGLDFDALQAELAKLKVEGYTLSVRKVSKQHLSASKFDVIDPGQKAYRHLQDINEIVDAAALSPTVQEKAKRIFARIAAAEAKIHDMPVEKVHFHEIGAIDTIIDVVGTLVGLELLGVTSVLCSRLNVGSGFVTFSHGKYPVPAPATAELLTGVPVYATEIEGELVTPTGAAIITELAEFFGPMPTLEIGQVGYGAGDKEFAQPNVLRVFLGKSHSAFDAEADEVCVIETNIDDMNPQLYETVFEKVLSAGALDVFTSNILMKKNRPAVKLSVLCQPGDESRLAEVLLVETSSLGVRVRYESRQKLRRESLTVQTSLGQVRFKLGMLAGEQVKASPEYEDCKKIAAATGLPVRVVIERLKAEFRKPE